MTDVGVRGPAGGVLGRGCVQEEIRFARSPELVAARLVCQRLGGTWPPHVLIKDPYVLIKSLLRRLRPN